MRLVDADAIIATHESEQCAIGRDWSVEDLAVAIQTAPTIDAIPVEWIIKWSNKRYRETQRDVSIVDVLEAWQKEQEAR